MKYLVRLEADRIKVFRLKKGPRQMVSLASRLYRVDDHLMIKDMSSDDCMVFYDIDSTQPYMVDPEVVDPDITRAYIDSAKLSGNKRSIWTSLNPSKAWEWLTIIAVVGALLYGFLVAA